MVAEYLLELFLIDVRLFVFAGQRFTLFSVLVTSTLEH